MSVFSNEFTKGQIMSFYDQTVEDGVFHVGRYLCKDDDFVLFQAISTRGYDDGLYLIPTDYIFRIDIDDDYTKRIERLFALQKQHCPELSFSGEKSILIQLIDYAEKNRLVTSLFFEDGEDITGQMIDVDPEGDRVRVQMLTQDGEKNGTSFVSIDRIEKVVCDSGLERMIEMLMTE